MSKGVLFFTILTIIVVSAFFIYKQSAKYPDTYKYGIWPEADSAINQAKLIYRTKKKTLEDISNGPCLSNDLMPGWVADLVHNPRQAVDDLPQNQCSAYIEGRAKHFIELDLDGNLVRVR